MRACILSVYFFFVLAIAACVHKPADDGRSQEQRNTAKKTDEAAKKGALTEKVDPAADLKKQQLNLERLHANSAGARAAGNHVAAWAADWDARGVEKLIAKDRQLVGEAQR